MTKYADMWSASSSNDNYVVDNPFADMTEDAEVSIRLPAETAYSEQWTSHASWTVSGQPTWQWEYHAWDQQPYGWGQSWYTDGWNDWAEGSQSSDDADTSVDVQPITDPTAGSSQDQLQVATPPSENTAVTRVTFAVEEDSEDDDNPWTHFTSD